ncbi:hypothetical protein C348_01473 [Cryptococcus neoformans Gb118]|nr:hypothetical protein C348_01473 [Cryptococcus neoformans var. grubii Gb118]
MPNTPNPLFLGSPHYVYICAQRIYKPRPKHYLCLS